MQFSNLLSNLLFGESCWWLFGFSVEFPCLSVATMLRGSKSLSPLQTLPMCRADTYNQVFHSRLYNWRHMLWSLPCDIYYMCLLNISKDQHDFFFSVIYWMLLTHFKQILSTRWSDFTAKAFSLWKGGCCIAWLNDVNIGGLQLAFAIALEVKVDYWRILEILKCRYTFLCDYRYFFY